MIIDLKEATLDDVAKNYQDVIKEACESESYYDDLRDLINESVGNDYISTVLSYPNAFKALQDAGFVTWNVLVLDTESNINKLINAGFDRSDVLAAIASDIFYGSPYVDESPSFLCDTFEKYDSSHIKTIVHNNHPNIDESYLDEIVDYIANFCEEMSNIREFLSGNN